MKTLSDSFRFLVLEKSLIYDDMKKRGKKLK